MTSSFAKTSAIVLAGTLAIVATAFVYAPIRANWFYADDFIHLVDVANLPLGEVIMRPFLGHLYVVPQLVFAALLRAFGPAPPAFYTCALALHLVNVGLLFLLVRRLFGSTVLAALTAAWWGTLPLHENTLGWFSVHGHCLAGMGLLVALNGLLGAVGRRDGLSPLAAAWLALVLIAGASSFGTGIVVAFGVPLMAWALARQRRRTGWWRGPVILAAAPVVVTALYVAAHLRASHPLDHSIPSTLLGWAAEQPGLILRMFVHLVGFGITRAVGGLAAAVPYPAPSTLACAGIVIAGGLMAARQRSPARVVVLGLLGITAASYALVALGRVVAYSDIYNIVPRDAAQTGRYHYVGTIGLTVAAAGMMATITQALPQPGWARLAITTVAVVLAVRGYRSTPWEIDHHEESRRAVTWVMAAVQQAIPGVPPGGEVRIKDQPFLPLHIPPDRGVSWAGVWGLYHPEPTYQFRRIRFVTRHRALFESAPPGSVLAGLLEAAPDMY